MENATYLGDGLYVQDDGFQFRLFTQRGDETHEVYLDSSTMSAFLSFIEKSRGVKVKINRE